MSPGRTLFLLLIVVAMVLGLWWGLPSDADPVKAEHVPPPERVRSEQPKREAAPVKTDTDTRSSRTAAPPVAAPPADRVIGYVYGPDGKPAKDAVVFAMHPRMTDWRQEDFGRHSRWTEPGHWPESARSDASGRFNFEERLGRSTPRVLVAFRKGELSEHALWVDFLDLAEPGELHLRTLHMARVQFVDSFGNAVESFPSESDQLQFDRNGAIVDEFSILTPGGDLALIGQPQEELHERRFYAWQKGAMSPDDAVVLRGDFSRLGYAAWNYQVRMTSAADEVPLTRVTVYPTDEQRGSVGFLFSGLAQPHSLTEGVNLKVVLTDAEGVERFFAIPEFKLHPVDKVRRSFWLHDLPYGVYRYRLQYEFDAPRKRPVARRLEGEFAIADDWTEVSLDCRNFGSLELKMHYSDGQEALWPLEFRLQREHDEEIDGTLSFGGRDSRVDFLDPGRYTLSLPNWEQGHGDAPTWSVVIRPGELTTEKIVLPDALRDVD